MRFISDCFLPGLGPSVSAVRFDDPLGLDVIADHLAVQLTPVTNWLVRALCAPWAQIRLKQTLCRPIRPDAQLRIMARKHLSTTDFPAFLKIAEEGLEPPTRGL
jgi:hypothetical protein